TAGAQGVSPITDLRSPDARNGAPRAQTPQAQDLRSPDARNGATSAQTSQVQVPSAPQVVSTGTTSSSSAFQWGDAGIGAAGMLALMSLGAGAVLLLGRHRRRRGHSVATLEERVDEIRTVMDAAGMEQAALLGESEGGPAAILFAATHPARTVSLVLYGSVVKGVLTDSDLAEFGLSASEVEAKWSEF